jgi:hypothetical protein
MTWKVKFIIFVLLVVGAYLARTVYDNKSQQSRVTVVEKPEPKISDDCWRKE